MDSLYIYRLEYDEPVFLGLIDRKSGSFSYDADYLNNDQALPLSLSLPLRAEAFPEEEMRPYFEGLLAEGPARKQLASRLQVAEDDYLSILEECGHDCIGDIVVLADKNAISKELRYSELDLNDIHVSLDDASIVLDETIATRLSLAGTQNKTGIAFLESAEGEEGVWLQPQGLAATTHIIKTSHLRDVPEIEFLCMNSARFCGIDAARVFLLDRGASVLAVERFDRKVEGTNLKEFKALRLHQEDMAQSFGITSASKYAELKGGTVSSITDLFRQKSLAPGRDLAEFAKMLCFAYLIGDCDAHLKNFSLIHLPGHAKGELFVRLAPAYDFVSTTYFPRFSRDMAMDFGGIRNIDQITPANFEVLAADLGITKGILKSILSPIVDNVLEGITRASKGGFGSVMESTPYIADDLIEDILPRLKVAKQYISNA